MDQVMALLKKNRDLFAFEDKDLGSTETVRKAIDTDEGKNSCVTIQSERRGN